MAQEKALKLLDANILIDALNGADEAVAWLGDQKVSDFGIPSIAAMEVIHGCHTRRELRQAERFIQQFTLVCPTSMDCKRAYKLMRKRQLSDGPDIPDLLIGYCALGLGATLYTQNDRDFRCIKGLDVVRPY